MTVSSRDPRAGPVSSRDPRAGPSLSRDLSGRSLTLGVRSPVTLFVVLIIRLRG